MMIEKIPFMIYSQQFPHEMIDIYTSHYDVTPTLFDLIGH
jgi:arylsulfatase A-like enzyme